MINQNLEARVANYDDIPEIMELLRQVNNIHATLRPDMYIFESTKYSEEEVRAILDDPNKEIFVVVDNGTILGHAFVEVKNNEGSRNQVYAKELYLEDLCVNENTRLMGCGNALMNIVFEYAKEYNCNKVTLHCCSGNDAANFYEKLGFKPTYVSYELKIEE